MKTVDCWELMIGHEMYLFASHADAVGAVAAMMRGAQLYGPADPNHKAARVGLKPIEARIQRREIAVPMARAVAALGAGVQATQLALPNAPAEAPAPAGRLGPGVWQ